MTNAADVISEVDRLLDLLCPAGIVALVQMEYPLRRIKRKAIWGQLSNKDLEVLAELRESVETQSGMRTWRW